MVKDLIEKYKAFFDILKNGDYINEEYFPKISKAKIEINNKLNGGDVMYTGVADLIYNDAIEEGIIKGR